MFFRRPPGTILRLVSAGNVLLKFAECQQRCVHRGILTIQIVSRALLASHAACCAGAARVNAMSRT